MNDNQTKMFVNGVFNFFFFLWTACRGGKFFFALNSLQVVNNVLVQYV